LNQYELEHIEIRNRGLKIIKLNSVEKALMEDANQHEDEAGGIFGGMRVSNDDTSQNSLKILVGEEFEIKTSHIVYRQDILCRSVCGLPVYVLTISAANARRKRRVIYITARVHAGETPSSFVMQKVI